MPRHSEATLAAIKRSVDLAALIGESLPLSRSGSRYKALCPFHDDHNPSLEVNPERQSFKCWSCGAGGDVFDFVQMYDRVEFPEALRMLAERAGIALDSPDDRDAGGGPSKGELLAVCGWAEAQYAAALAGSDAARAYLDGRGISAPSVAAFRLGYAPETRDWLVSRARKQGYSPALLEAAGLVVRDGETRQVRERFRGRLIFPIRDPRGRPIAFGGRVLPDLEKRLAELGRKVAKYVNSPETVLFQKRRTLYAADLARAAARAAGWVAVVEGYTDVIAAHQVGLSNVVGTLGTALGDDHIAALNRLADRVVLVFDGDEAGQKAADRSIELFLGHEIDVRVLVLPDDLDPCDFLLREGPAPFRGMLESATDPLEFLLGRAAGRFDFDSAEGARQAAQWILAILAKVPTRDRSGLEVKVGKVLDKLSHRLRVPVKGLHWQLRHLRRPGRKNAPAEAGEPATAGAVSEGRVLQVTDLDPLDRELVQIALNEPESVGVLAPRVPAEALRDAPLRAILQACYDLWREGQPPTFERVALRLDPAVRALAAGLLLPIDRALPEGAVPAAWPERLRGVLARLEERRRHERLRDLQAALAEVDPKVSPDDHRALRCEYLRVLNQRPSRSAS